MVAAQDPPQRVFATHDHTTTTGSSTNLREAWVDVKAPGNGRIYYVGTIEVEDTENSPEFSGSPVDIPTSSWPTFDVTTSIQIVIVQCTDVDGDIQWQRYFYGDNASETPRTRATNARGISVWPADEPGDVRVAICGETYDIALPGNSSTFSPATAAHPTGFVAVFDDDGNLEWSYQFHGRYGLQDCAITDLSIRAETVGETTYDVVTYCGISSHGVPDITTPLTPLLPFTAQIGSANCFDGGDGDEHHGTDQWDGIVGRIRHDRSGGTTSRVFHSIVGGSEQDGLYGIAELDANRFAVVGSTVRSSPPNSPASNRAFPFSNSTTTCWNDEENYCVGALLVFDASDTVSSQPLVLEAAHEIGSVGEDIDTVARDIVVNRIFDNEDDLHSFYIVGSTNDAEWIDNLLTLNGTTPAAGFQGTIGGGADGFVLWGFIAPFTTATPVTFYVGSYYGGPDQDGLTGVQSWNEYWGSAAVVGFTTDLGANPAVSDVLAGSIFCPDHTAQTMSRIRQDQIGGSSIDLPTALGEMNAYTDGLAWNERGLGSPAGGGVAVDQRARVSICGTSDTTGGTEWPPTGGGRAGLGGNDAVTATYEMLPQGVYRTDGTGTSNLITVPQPSPSTYDGGSSPTACMAPFGLQIGTTTPELTRILIDYEGDAPAVGVQNAVLLANGWPLLSSAFVGAVIQFGAPASSPFVPPGTSLELWVTNNPVTLTASSTGRWPMFAASPGMPSGVHAFTVQVTVLLWSSVSCDPAGAVASPALVFDY